MGIRQGLIRTGFGAERDGHPVPRVDAGDCPGEVGQFLIGELAADGIVDGVGNVAVGYVCQGFGPFEGGPFTVVVVGCLTPRVETVQPLLAFTGGPGVFPVHVDAVSAAVHL
jgi:hypothetical protein